jgi:predicted permease
VRDLVQDLRFGLRTLARRPGFALTAVLMLGLGIGAPITAFTLVDRIFFEHPPAVAEPDRLLAVYRTSPLPASLGNPDYLYYREGTTTLSGLAAYGRATTAAFAVGGGETGQLQVAFTSENYFDVLGVEAHRGRFFLPEENAVPGGVPVVVLSHGFWTRALGRDPRIVGGQVTLNGRAFTVVGITPAAFRGLRPTDEAPDAWTPIAMYGTLTGASGRSWWERSPTDRSNWLSVFGRLAPGASLEAVEANFTALSEALEYPGRDPGEGAIVMRQYLYSAGQAAALTRLSTLLVAVVAMVLAIAGANVTVLLLSRATTRGREIGVRAAMGAGRGRIFRQLLAESVLLGLAGGLVGIGIAFACADRVASLLPYRFAGSFAPDAGVLLAGVMLSLITACAVGLAPALLASRADVVSLMGDARVVGVRSRCRDALVVGQVAISLVLIAGALLFGRSFHAAASQDVGWSRDGRLVLEVDLRSHGYDAERGLGFVDRALERIASLPGVTGVTATRMVPFGGEMSFEVEPAPERFPGAAPGALLIGLNGVGPGYFEVMGIRVLRGRPLGAADTENAPPVAVVNETLAKALWPGEDPLGKRLPPISGREPTVVGVARDATYYELGESGVTQAYVPYAQAYSGSVHFVVRTEGDAAAGAGAVQEALRELDPTLPLRSVTTLEARFDEVVARYRVSAVLVGVFSALALVLAATGLYGVVSYLVTQRAREIGVRIALGASRARVAREVVAAAARLTGLGVALGIGAALALRGSVGALLYRVEPGDPWALIGACGLLGAVAAIASLAPARRASRVDPLEAIRAE